MGKIDVATASGGRTIDEIVTESSDVKTKQNKKKKKVLTVPLYDIMASEKKNRKKTYTRKRHANDDKDKSHPKKIQHFVSVYDGILPSLDVSIFVCILIFEILMYSFFPTGYAWWRSSR